MTSTAATAIALSSAPGKKREMSDPATASDRATRLAAASKPEDPQQIEDLLRGRFGLSSFRPGQREVIEALLRDRAALAVFPTGGGKSLCYQLPALMFPGITVVVSPLIALMKDQIDFLLGRGIAAARLDSSLSAVEVKDISVKLRSGELKLLYVAPERFANERFLQMLAGLTISLFAVDEAHSISEWGHNFRPDYLKLAGIAKDIKAERILALTATATPPVVESICRGFGIPPSGAVVTGFYRPNLRLLTTPAPADARDERLVAALRGRPLGPGIVYVTLQKTAERVAKLLASAGFSADAYHAGLPAEERARVQETWMASDKHIVVATIAFGMGIDKADVRTVLHYNLPKSLESYSQEIGRAGRDGASSVVELFATEDDIELLEGFACGDTPTREALTGLVTELLSAPRAGAFPLELGALGDRHDLRPLVLKTALTHLELAGVVKQGTPFYATYQVEPLIPVKDIVAMFTGERAEFVRRVLDGGKKGRTWVTIDTDALARTLLVERSRIVKALEWLAEQSKVRLQVKDLRHRYELLQPDADGSALVEMLAARFHQHEERELARLREVIDLVQLAGCQTNALVAHFGEKREMPCGHCSFCETGKAVTPSPRQPLPSLSSVVDEAAILALRAKHPGALGHPRQLARFLCSLSSPAVSKAKLSRHPLFGAASERRFHDVLAWCEER